MFPINRNRRLRSSKVIRDLVSENKINLTDLIVPLFIKDGKNIKEEIESMPSYYRMSLDVIEKEVKFLYEIGLKSVLLFVKVSKTKEEDFLVAISDFNSKIFFFNEEIWLSNSLGNLLLVTLEISSLIFLFFLL